MFGTLRGASDHGQAESHPTDRSRCFIPRGARVAPRGNPPATRERRIQYDPDPRSHPEPPVRPSTLAVALLVMVPARVLGQGDVSGHARPITVSSASRARTPIRIDGRLDEEDWAGAAVTDSFTQIDPDEGRPASQRTEVRVLYDDHFLYVGARMFDTGPVTARLGRRDMDPGDSDWLILDIDSYHDHRTAFCFHVNPAGVRRDAVKTIDVDDTSWDPVWDVATTVDRAGWTAEFRIPFSQLRFSAAREQTWGIQFERLIGRIHENAVSTFIPKSERGGVPLFGHLTGLEGIRAGKRLEILPYGVERRSYIVPGSPDNHVTGGVDVLYRLASALTLNTTFNPDFGQVEVDPAVVNLGVYETYFAEKRPFFIEGSEIFDFGAAGTSGGQIFYSRRIGRSPPLAPGSDPATIIGAGKLSGKPGGWSVGALEAVTAKEKVAGVGSVEPLSSYLVGRARREWRGGQTFFGGIVTAVNRQLDTQLLRDNLHSNAWAGGMDFRHEWGRRSWAVFGDAEVSRVQGSRAAITATQRRGNHFFQRPDATHLGVDTLATSLTGYSVNLQTSKQSGEHWRGGLGTAFTSPKYEVNDLGFSYRTDRRDFQATLTYLQNHPGRLLRHWNINGEGRLERNFAWQPILSFVTATATAQTLRYWTLQSGATRYFRAYDDRLTRGGPLAIRPAWWSPFATVASDDRKPVVATVSLGGDSYESGAWDWNVGVTLGIKSSTRWSLTAGPNLSRSHTPAQYVGTVADPAYGPTYGRRYVFAPLQQTSVNLEARLNVTFTPRLTLETYVQPLLSSADYGDPEQLVAPRTYTFASYGGGVPDLDFNLRSLRGNAVLRWEWRQGSTMYVAWQQRREDLAAVGDFSFARDRAALFRARPEDVVIVKVSYWLNP
jgi:uncharacterized protein DUF5916/cellulose/xylan binding protein with CBM9 domain